MRPNTATAKVETGNSGTGPISDGASTPNKIEITNPGPEGESPAAANVDFSAQFDYSDPLAGTAKRKATYQPAAAGIADRWPAQGPGARCPGFGVDFRPPPRWASARRRSPCLLPWSPRRFLLKCVDSWSVSPLRWHLPWSVR